MGQRRSIQYWKGSISHSGNNSMIETLFLESCCKDNDKLAYKTSIAKSRYIRQVS